MDKRIGNTQRVNDLLCKLEYSNTFAQQFNSAQEYIEWSLEEVIKWFDKHPHKEIKGYVEL